MSQQVPPADTTPALRLKRVGVHTYGENVAFISAQCAAYEPESFASLNKVEITGGGRTIMASLNIVENGDLLDPLSLGLSIPAFDDLNLAEGAPVHLKLARPPRSMDAVRRKVAGEPLSPEQMMDIVTDIAGRRYSKIEITAFLVASAAFMTTAEVLSLTTAMAAVGTRLAWDQPPTNFTMVMDKHCVGGIPGNRTSMIVVPIIAAHGLPIPKTSSRAITSPAGTADTMEVLANVDVDIARMRDIVGRHHGCLVWGGHVNLSPADDVMITVERPLGIDTPEQMVASILSKKLSAGSTHLVIDIPVGPTAKVRSSSEAARLKKLFEYIGGRTGLTIEVVVTDGRQPIGFGIGPVLEARDVMAVLRKDATAPRDLRERALHLAGRLLEFDPNLRGGQGYARAAELLDSGAALSAMESIIAAQGPVGRLYAPGNLIREVCAPAAGTVAAIDCYRIARIARLAGAPVAKGAGIDLRAKIGTAVRAGDPLYRIHAAAETDFTFASDMAMEANGYDIR